MAFVLSRKADPGSAISADRSNPPKAPGAVSSPQIPGQVPDRSTIPGEDQVPAPPIKGEPRRPITEYGSAQRIMNVYAPEGGNEDDPARFEQAPVSYEEFRKSNPALRTPLRPKPGYALADGIRQSTRHVPALDEPGTVNEVAPGE